jgi:hypothetical protein
MQECREPQPPIPARCLAYAFLGQLAAIRQQTRVLQLQARAMRREARAPSIATTPSTTQQEQAEPFVPEAERRRLQAICITLCLADFPPTWSSLFPPTTRADDVSLALVGALRQVQ